MSKFKVGDPVRPALHIAGRWRKLLNVSAVEGDKIRINRSKIWYSEADFQHAPVKREDPYAELKQAYVDGHTIQICFTPTGSTWCDLLDEPIWEDPVEHYRIKPKPTKPPVRHIHADLIKIWVEDMLRPVQFRYESGECWLDIAEGRKPTWSPTIMYRFKPSQAELDLMGSIDAINASMARALAEITLSEQRVDALRIELTEAKYQLTKLQG